MQIQGHDIRGVLSRDHQATLAPLVDEATQLAAIMSAAYGTACYKERQRKRESR